MKYFGNKCFKLMLKIFLIMLLFFLVVRFFSKDVIEGARGRRRRRRRRRRKWKRKQNKVKEVINSLSTGYGNISSCAVPYSDSVQFSETTGLFNIFGNDKILQCKKQVPKMVPAKKSKYPSGINLLPSGSSATTTSPSSHMKYGDEVALCSSSKIYKLTNASDASSSDKIKYGDNLQMVPVSEPTSSTFNVTVNPNVYGLSNLYKMSSSDFSNAYVNNYAYCGNSTSDGVIMATDD